MLVYHNKFIFHTLSVETGNPLNDGMICAGNTFQVISMVEFNDYLSIVLHTTAPSTTSLILINPDARIVSKQFVQDTNFKSYRMLRQLINGKEYILFSGERFNPEITFMARTYIEDIYQLPEMTVGTSSFSQLMGPTSNYLVTSPTSAKTLTTINYSISGSTSISISDASMTSSLTRTYYDLIALWNDKHLETVQRDSIVKIDFIWACSHPSNVTSITFSLNQTGSTPVPDWVLIDIPNQELYLNSTPKVNENTVFLFSLKIVDTNSEDFYKEFEITVQGCTVNNCEK